MSVLQRCSQRKMLSKHETNPLENNHTLQLYRNHTTHGGSPENLQNTFRTPLSGRTPVETASVCQKSFKRLEL